MNPSYQRSLILHAQGRYADAANALRQSLATEPNDPLAHAMLGLCLSQLEDYQSATVEAQAAVGLAPTLGFAHYVYALVMFRRHDRDVPIPFGPYLAGGGIAALFFGEQLTHLWMPPV